MRCVPCSRVTRRRALTAHGARVAGGRESRRRAPPCDPATRERYTSEHISLRSPPTCCEGLNPRGVGDVHLICRNPARLDQRRTRAWLGSRHPVVTVYFSRRPPRRTVASDRAAAERAERRAANDRDRGRILPSRWHFAGGTGSREGARRAERQSGLPKWCAGRARRAPPSR